MAKEDSGKAQGKLSRARIVEAALELFDREGARGFSMRKLAAGLGVDPMALYHYHRNKRALIADVLDTYLAQFHVPERTDDWRCDLRAICMALRGLAHAHPGAFRVYELYEDRIASEHRIHEALHAVLARGGLSGTQTVRAARLILTYTEAFAVDEVSGWIDPEDAQGEGAYLRALPAGTYPVMQGLAADLEVIDADADFDFGLRVVIAGLERLRGQVW